ncbi:MAG: hypothetical protein JEZ00_16335 [Anaerolineaceae bacterium]|nr:hypothetical protein [Anaerolineaceae bacterium]
MSQAKQAILDWLLEEEDIGVRYLALRDLCDLADDDRDLIRAKELAHTQGPIAAILDEMHPEGYWMKPGAGYLPKYRSTVWSLVLLAQLGADIEIDARIERGCRYLFENAFNEHGQFGAQGTAASTADCLQGNLCAAMLDLGYEDERLDKAFEWMARSTTGEGVAPMKDRKAPLRYYSGKIGPDFLCGANNKLACAWGATKVMMAFAKLPSERHTALIQQAIQRGIDFLLAVDPAEAAYPTGWNDNPSRNWWKFGFPVFYVTDMLQILEVFATLNKLDDSRLKNAINLLESKQDEQGKWPLEYSYTGKTWVDFGALKQPNKWVTLRALRVLKK